MHLDGCHFFAWVFENPQGDSELTYYERSGDDLMYHMNPDECERCATLYNGAASLEASTTIELPEDAKEAFIAVLTAIVRVDPANETPAA